MVGRSRLQLPVGPGERPALAHRARAHLEQASRAAADFSGAGHESRLCTNLVRTTTLAAGAAKIGRHHRALLQVCPNLLRTHEPVR